MLEKIKLLLGVDDEVVLLETIVGLTESKVLSRINEKVVPPELEFIIVEASIARYNRMGSEGISSESVDGRTQSYESDLGPYEQILSDYVSNKKGSGLRVF